MICWPCADFLTRPSACLPAYLFYLSEPACACLLCLPVYAYLSVSVIWGRGRPDRRICLIRSRLIVLIWIVFYGHSLAVCLNGGALFGNGLILRLWFDLIWSIESIVWFWRRSSPTYLPTCLPTYLPACLPTCLPTYITLASLDVILLVRIFNRSASWLTTFMRNHLSHISKGSYAF